MELLRVEHPVVVRLPAVNPAAPLHRLVEHRVVAHRVVQRLREVALEVHQPQALVQRPRLEGRHQVVALEPSLEVSHRAPALVGAHHSEVKPLPVVVLEGHPSVVRSHRVSQGVLHKAESQAAQVLVGRNPPPEVVLAAHLVVRAVPLLECRHRVNHQDNKDSPEQPVAKHLVSLN